MKEMTETNASRAILSFDWQLAPLSIDLVHRFGRKAGAGSGGGAGVGAKSALIKSGSQEKDCYITVKIIRCDNGSLQCGD